MQSNRLRNRGFTLIELAVSIVVIGLLLALGMAMVGPLMTSIKVRETKETIGGVIETLNSWTAGNNSLPDTAVFTTIAKSPSDSWGRPFIYLYDSNLQTATPTKDTICGRRSTFITLTDNNTGAVIQNVAYLVLSQGDEATTNSTIGGVAVTSSARSAATAVIADTANDIVRWVTLDELRTKVGCQGAQLRLANNELPFGNKGSAYPTIPFVPDGGVQFNPATTGTYEWCWSSTTPQVLTDLVFTCVAPSSAATIARTASPTSCSPTTGTWQRCTNLTLSSVLLNGINPPPGSFDISIFLRDNAGNFAQKTFVLTINPQ